MLEEHIETGNDRLCAQIEKIAATKRSMQITPSRANVSIDAKIRKCSESEISGELAKVADWGR